METIISVDRLPVSRLIIVDDPIGFASGDDFGSLVELESELRRKHRWIDGISDSY